MSLITPGSVVTVDADGVVFDFIAQWEAVMALALGRPVPTIHNETWCLGEKYGLTQDELAHVWQEFNRLESWRHIRAFPGAAGWINRMANVHRCQVHIVTSIDAALFGQRAYALQQCGIEPMSVLLHCVGHLNSKLSAFRRIGPAVHIDDNAAHLTEAKLAGVPARILVRGPFREHADATHVVSRLTDIGAAMPAASHKFFTRM